MPEDPTSDPQDRAWYGPHDRLFIPEESEVINFVPGPEYVWCWVSRGGFQMFEHVLILCRAGTARVTSMDRTWIRFGSS
jgi:hypothetical protein